MNKDIFYCVCFIFTVIAINLSKQAKKKNNNWCTGMCKMQTEIEKSFLTP